ncbi:hypothetical protein BT96DRAFT_640559 [Gymnopus androsaceus JB14]|uniref:Protein kinase domain-containing protein n=1 Tax=Gymnopus androsaceus JB14 TaxID=1447944 RepID=A0A6A4GGM4_9AGAR|nr:hypothetical protein BT96DRAFT_640559 [Gymnopus androsaceus JB14]
MIRHHWPIELIGPLRLLKVFSYIHSKAVVWADAHLSNVLVTRDLHVVLADFAFSLISPSPFHALTTLPPPIFACPKGYYGRTPNRVDIFAFGVMLFALLMTRFPWTTNLNPSVDEQIQAMHTHGEYKWDVMEDKILKDYFGPVVEKCFKIGYTNGKEIFDDMKEIGAKWFQEVENKQ